MRHYLLDLELLCRNWHRKDPRVVELIGSAILYVPTQLVRDMTGGAVELEIYGSASRSMRYLGVFSSSSSRIAVHTPCEGVIEINNSDKMNYYQYVCRFWDRFTIGTRSCFKTPQEVMSTSYHEGDWLHEMEREQRRRYEQRALQAQQNMYAGLPPWMHDPLRYPMFEPSVSEPEPAKVEKPDIDSLMIVKADKEVKKFKLKIEL